MNFDRLINVTGAILAILTIILGGVFPNILWLILMALACFLLIYKTNINPINILGWIIAFTLGILHLYFRNEWSILFTGLPGFLIMITTATMIFYHGKKTDHDKRQTTDKRG